MICYFLRFGAVADVFAQARENRSDFLASQRLGGDERVIQRLSRHEA